MKKSKYMGIVITVLFVFSCSERTKYEKIENSKKFFEKITKDNGTWVHQPKDTTIGYDSFTMMFLMAEPDTLKGTISGLTKIGDTIVFWNVTEYKDLKIDSVIFEQKGQMGSVKSTSYFPDSIIRKSNFEIVYSNGAAERHKDTQIFLNDSTILTKNEIFDLESQIWIKQPEAIWKRSNLLDYEKK